MSYYKIEKQKLEQNLKEVMQMTSVPSAQIAQNPLLAAGLTSKKAKCHNCKFASKQFKVGTHTHLHCQNEDLYPTKDFESGKLTAWDTLMSWYNSCKSHQFKDVK